MTTKRRQATVNRDYTPSNTDDLMIIKPLGAGQEVGRSCHILSYKKKTIMLDCGIHPGLTGFAALPFFDACDPAEIDLLLISHFHLDHIASLPYFMEKTNFKGRVFMTHPTKAIFKSLLSDFVKLSKISTEDMLFDEHDLDNCMERIETMNFHQQIEVNGIKFIPFNAGHVLGAALLEIEIAGVRILYTGDYSREDDRHLMAAEIPPCRPDVLIIESTYGTEVHEPSEEREHRFTSTVDEIVSRGGRCLIPVLALGRAQELLLIIDEYWEVNPRLQSIPIYYASSLANQCMSVYQTYIHMMNRRIQEQFSVSEENPFYFKHIKSLKSLQHFNDSGPAVFFASPGMLQSGTSRKLFDRWCSNPKNGCVICGYCVEGTLAKKLIQVGNVTEITTFEEGMKKPLKMSITEISFSAHADYVQTSTFIEALLPPHIVLVHGEASMMAKLRAALEKTYGDREDVSTTIYTPRNTEAVELYFRGEKKVKVLGTLAQFEPSNDTNVSGILVKKKFNYLLLDSEDLAEYAGLPVTTITQRQVVEYHFPFSVLKIYLAAMFTDLKFNIVSDDARESIQVFDAVTIIKESESMLALEWPANTVNDMIADAVVASIIQIELNPSTAKMIGSSCSHTHRAVPSKTQAPLLHSTCVVESDDARRDKERLRRSLLLLLESQYECVSVGKKEGTAADVIHVDTGTAKAVVFLETLDVECDDQNLARLIKNLCTNVVTSVNLL
ncbi:cleavage and polyadenylation specificity factor subunit 3-like [Zophobas morio]|uniref:cleavage and polyadenylation specificity factor subunit 3-like n=1 Tax=Zophobas morio TaxID=2755281 RepID=UPI0030836D63